MAIIGLVAMRAKQAAYERDLLAANWKVELSELTLNQIDKVGCQSVHKRLGVCYWDWYQI